MVGKRHHTWLLRIIDDSDKIADSSVARVTSNIGPDRTLSLILMSLDVLRSLGLYT